MARRVKALQNNKKGISPNHRDHRTHKVQNLKKKIHDKQWKLKRAARLEKREKPDYEAIQESLTNIPQHEED